MSKHSKRENVIKINQLRTSTRPDSPVFLWFSLYSTLCTTKTWRKLNWSPVKYYRQQIQLCFVLLLSNIRGCGCIYQVIENIRKCHSYHTTLTKCVLAFHVVTQYISHFWTHFLQYIHRNTICTNHEKTVLMKFSV